MIELGSITAPESVSPFERGMAKVGGVTSVGFVGLEAEPCASSSDLEPPFAGGLAGCVDGSFPELCAGPVTRPD